VDSPSACFRSLLDSLAANTVVAIEEARNDTLEPGCGRSSFEFVERGPAGEDDIFAFLLGCDSFAYEVLDADR